MSDQNNSHDNLERFFQKKASEYEISYREEDWLKLEKKLDVRDMRQIYQRRMQWMVAASVLIASLLGYFTYDNHNRIKQIGQQMNREETQEIQSIPDNQTYQDDIQIPSVGQTPEREENASPYLSSDDQGSSPSTLVTAENDISSETASSSNQHLWIKDEAGQITKVDPPLISSVTQPSYETGSPTFVMAGYDERKQSKPINKEIYTPKISLFSAGLVIAPDLSTVGSISNFYDPGYKIGVTLEYNLSRNLGISAGVIQSKVRYLVNGEDYNPSSYLTYGQIPDETLGECLLIDIPLTLKYQFLNFSRSRFYATTGLSSYIMLNEVYRFSYESYDPDLSKGWSGRTGTTHLMSNAGFSVGFEFDIHPNWSLRAEPFIKVPISEVGRGNVKLYSIGSFVSFSYKFTAGK
ncbi:MAG: outer membrane beta-barrel protein [Balneolales bacterium]